MTWHACSVTPPARRLVSQGPVAAHCRAQTDACCWEKQQQIDNNRLKISIGINNHLQIAYLAFQCLLVLYEVCHFRYWYRNRYRFSISIGSIGIGGIGGIVLTLKYRLQELTLRWVYQQKLTVQWSSTNSHHSKTTITVVSVIKWSWAVNMRSGDRRPCSLPAFTGREHGWAINTSSVFRMVVVVSKVAVKPSTRVVCTGLNSKCRHHDNHSEKQTATFYKTSNEQHL